MPFKTLQDARQAYNDACETLHNARTRESRATRFGYCDDERLIRATLDAQSVVTAIVRDAIAQFGIESDCATCRHQSVFPGGPRHDASMACESGHNPHCSCDTCF